MSIDLLLRYQIFELLFKTVVIVTCWN